MFDFHLHSRFSCDSEGDPYKMAKALEEKGFLACCFTEHLDAWQELGSEVEARIPDLAAYRAAVTDIAGKCSSLSVGFGIEVGFCDELIPPFCKILEDWAFDFIICSQHLVGNQDPYDQVYFQGKTQHKAYALYLQEILRILHKVTNYDVIGHIGYLTRYWPGPEPKALRYADFADLIDEILTYAVDHGKGLEVNTSGFPQTGDFLPVRSIIARYLELGGEILTVGSDAHSPERVGAYIPEALDVLRSLGAKYICTFSARKPVFHKL